MAFVPDAVQEDHATCTYFNCFSDRGNIEWDESERAGVGIKVMIRTIMRIKIANQSIVFLPISEISTVCRKKGWISSKIVAQKM